MPIPFNQESKTAQCSEESVKQHTTSETIITIPDIILLYTKYIYIIILNQYYNNI